MRALLINPWIYDFAAYDLWSKPLGLLTIASFLRKIGFKISLIDCLDRLHPSLKRHCHKIPRSTAYGSGRYCSEDIGSPSIFKKIPRQFRRYGLPKKLFEELIGQEPEPDVILVTTGMTYWYPSYIETIELLKKRFSAPVILGGNYVNICYEHAKNTSGADIVYKGTDIFGALRLIIEAAGSGFDRKLLEGHEHLFPAYELYRSLEYVTLRTSTGCPFRCAYCGWYLLNDKFEHRDPAIVVDEIEYFNKGLGVKNFSFYDDALLYDSEEHFLKIAEGIIERNIRALFHTPNGLHSRFLTEKLASLLKASGFVNPRLALETSSPARQADTAKTTNCEFLKALTYLKKAGYCSADIGVYILIGLPGHAVSEVETSIRFASENGVRIFLEEYSPIPGTKDYARTGLEENADPLMHNNSAFLFYNKKLEGKAQKLKDLVHGLNSRLEP